MFRTLVGMVVLCGLAYAAPPSQVYAAPPQLDRAAPPPPSPPSGGVDVSPDSPPPIYHTLSDFDFQSLVPLCLTSAITTYVTTLTELGSQSRVH